MTILKIANEQIKLCRNCLKRFDKEMCLDFYQQIQWIPNYYNTHYATAGVFEKRTLRSTMKEWEQLTEELKKVGWIG